MPLTSLLTGCCTQATSSEAVTTVQQELQAAVTAAAEKAAALEARAREAELAGNQKLQRFQERTAALVEQEKATMKKEVEEERRKVCLGGAGWAAYWLELCLARHRCSFGGI
jgi:hypothetical protein